MNLNIFKKSKAITPEESNEHAVKEEPPKELLHETPEQHPFDLGTSKTRVKLGIEKHLFSRTGSFVPILSSGSASPYRNLQIRGKVFESNDVVLEDATTRVPVAVVVRKYETAANSFHIYTPRPSYAGQAPANLFKYKQRLYKYAEVKRCGKVLNVVLEGQSQPIYTIHRVVPYRGRRYPTTHVIRKEGRKVASTRYGSGSGKSFFVTVESKDHVDPSLMICLAAIADEVYM